MRQVATAVIPAWPGTLFDGAQRRPQRGRRRVILEADGVRTNGAPDERRGHGSAHEQGFRRDIQGLRAISILMVVAVHAGLPGFSGGFVGVDVFFVISGFLITALLATDIEKNGRIRFAVFYTRRLRRLLPALLVMLVAVGFLARMLLPPGEQEIQAITGAMASLWLSNLQFALGHIDYFAPAAETNLFLHTWSLGVEEQFYLVWPLLISWLLAGRGYRRAGGALLAIVAASLSASMVYTTLRPEFAFYMMPLRAWQFAAGSLVWLFFASRARRSPASAPPIDAAAATAAGWIGLGLVISAGLLFDAKTPYPGLAALLPTVGAAGIIAAGSVHARNGVSVVLEWAPLQFLGRISYSWYLWHWPVLLFGRLLVPSNSALHVGAEVMLSLLLATLSYRLVEAPVRHQQYWLAHRKLAIFGSVGLMAIVAALGARWYYSPSNTRISPELQRYVRASSESPEVYARGCNADITSSTARACTFGPPHAAHTAVLIGDSTAAHWSPAAIKAFDRLGWRLLVMTKSGCPVVDGPYFYWVIRREFTECAAWRKQALDQVVALRPDIVILSSYWWDNRTSPQDWWIGGTRSVLNTLSPVAGHVYLMRSMPHLPFKGPVCLAQHLMLGRLAGSAKCEAPYPEPLEAQIFSWLQSATAGYPNVSTLDMNKFVCPKDRCDAERGGMIVFRDDHHVAELFAKSLGPALAEQLGIGPAESKPK